MCITKLRVSFYSELEAIAERSEGFGPPNVAHVLVRSDIISGALTKASEVFIFAFILAFFTVEVIRESIQCVKKSVLRTHGTQGKGP